MPHKSRSLFQFHKGPIKARSKITTLSVLLVSGIETILPYKYLSIFDGFNRTFMELKLMLDRLTARLVVL